MKLTGAQVYDATMALTDIANTNRVVPSMANFKLARMHDALEPAFKQIEAERIAAVQAHGSEKFADPEKTQSMGWGVAKSDAGYQAYIDAWADIQAKEFDVKITPITTTMLGNDPKGLTLMEFKMLGQLAVDNTEEER